ncbi:MAG: hypothetical protein IR158_10170 [Cellulomonas sp.]|uniref:hypothetical protein n=1 Tax=Cellulomonas sp. TaxID=40001 RepID=UPI0019E1B921|nr:hypothetical protein [Cellulomonas sp.]MBF0688111.1 hypothetical protein [Cellulomonas sp.]
MTDVHDLLARTHDALGRAEAPLDAARHDDLLSGIRRRRRRRHAGEVLGVGAAVVVLGATGWLGLQRDRTVQPADPTPTATSEPTGGATPDAASAPTATGLLPALVLPAGTLQAATPGWVLTTQAPTYWLADRTGVSGPTANVVDLVSPAGERYRVLDLPTDRPVSVVRWEAGSTQALVVTTDEERVRHGATLDLLTGGITLVAGLAGVDTHVGRTAADEDLWASSTSSPLLVHDGTRAVRELPPLTLPVLDAAGSRVAGLGGVPGADAGDGDPGSPVVVDVASGAVTVVPAPVDGTCEPFGWSGTEVLLSCWDLTAEGMVATGSWRYDAATPDVAPRPLVTDTDLGAATATGVGLPDGRLVVPGERLLECGAAWGVLDVDAGTFTRGTFLEDRVVGRIVGTDGSAAYVHSVIHCSGTPGPGELHRIDLATGEVVTLAPAPDGSGLPDGSAWFGATTSAVVAAPAR